ncbi:MAG: transporter substrate-binding domain-containing protein [Spirochaetes bacterium]|jgi:membrane-bound lytic murein transglycosylase F|nr:transporter substrate-binding domain-containing protein [Spirochaetota bacterium]
MKIYKIVLLFMILPFFVSCLGILDRMSGVTVEKIQERGALVAVTTYGANNYFVYRGEPLGFEYELLKLLADELNVKLEIKLTDGRVPLIDILNSDYGDIIASSITITKSRRKQYNFTRHFMKTRQVLVQRKTESGEIIDDVTSLIGKEVTITENSHYYNRLKNLSEEIGGDIKITTMPSGIAEEELIRMVSEGIIDYTVADETIAIINNFYYPNVDISTAVSFPQRIAWVVRRESPEFLMFVNDWLKRIESDGTLEDLYNKYYRINRVLEKQLAFSQDPDHKDMISAYDNMIRNYSYIVNWDWRLIAALIYQESRFNPRARSWAGAGGLMQLMPKTAAILGVTDRYDPEQNIFGGIRHLKSLSEQWKDRVPGEKNRLKFILASYNAGSGHVSDAQRLAAKYGKDPLLWDNNVEDFIIKLSSPEYYNDSVVDHGYCRGSEPYNYVRIILSRYEMYKENVSFIPAKEEVSAE